jgi:glycosyltransferase involved in cell wall biosynthesis
MDGARRSWSGMARAHIWRRAMKILTVAPYLPYEGIPHAGGEYLFRHLQGLTALGNQVTLMVPGIPEQLAHIASAPGWLNLITGPHVLKGRTTMRRLLDAVYRRSMNSPPSPSAESLRSVLAAGLVERARSADVVEFHWAEYARFASVLRRAGVSTPIVVVEHNVELNAVWQQVRDNAVGYRRLLGGLTAPLTRYLERHGLLDADLILVFKAADEKALRTARVPTPVHVIDPWLDQPDNSARQPRSRSVLFTGALWRKENEDGLLWFLDHAWPLVRSAMPDATLDLVGAAPSPKLQTAARATKGVTIIGDVPDLTPYYGCAAVFVAPLFVSGGLKFKIPQAMLCGLPVVATPVAVEGVVDVAPAGTLWGVTDDPVEMAAQLLAALSDPRRAEEVGAAAARWCAHFYSFQRSILRLHEMYGRLSGDRRSPGH